MTILTMLSRVRLPLEDEKAAQTELGRLLTDAGIAHEREVRLGSSAQIEKTLITDLAGTREQKRITRHEDIIDFMVGDVGIELKLKGSPTAIYRQLERYAAHDQVQHLVLLTGRTMGMPATLNGKPVSVVCLSRAFL